MVLKSILLHDTSPGHNKSYEVNVCKKGGTYTTTAEYGPIGEWKKYSTKYSGPSLEDANKALAKVVKQKLAKGYYEVDTSEFPEEPTKKASAAKKPVIAQPGDEPSLATGVQLLQPLANEADAEAYILDPAWGAQEKLDGKRIRLRYADGDVHAFNKQGKPCPVPDPVFEAMVDLAGFLNFKALELDGELIGEIYHAFDLLGYGLDCCQSAYEARHGDLEGFLETFGGAIKLVPLIQGEEAKKKLYKELKAQGREGIVFKRLDAPYTAGRGPDQVKCKFYATATCIVGAVNAKNSVALAMAVDDAEKAGDWPSVHQIVDTDGHWYVVPVGNVTIPPNKTKPKVRDFVEIRYLYMANKGGSLYQPVFLGVRDDVGFEDCHVDQLKYKSEGDFEMEEVPAEEPTEKDFTAALPARKLVLD
jgi:bifunctional non-homologous end joining protein LigD